MTQNGSKAPARRKQYRGTDCAITTSPSRPQPRGSSTRLSPPLPFPAASSPSAQHRPLDPPLPPAVRCLPPRFRAVGRPIQPGPVRWVWARSQLRFAGRIGGRIVRWAGIFYWIVWYCAEITAVSLL